MLHEWLMRPHAAAWWQPTPSIEELREDYIIDVTEPNATLGFIAHLDNRPIGFIQSYVVMGSGEGWWEDETDPGARGIDQFLANDNQLGKGIGRAMIRAFVARIFSEPKVTVLQTDPNPTNERAIKCYTAVGFRAQGLVSTPDGEALLMRCTRQTLT
jgi:RimJ/RimL family protein N-acetyltransferase